MLNVSDIEARAFLREMGNQTEDVRALSLYVICQTMLRQGLLKLVGASRVNGDRIALMFMNTDTGVAFEIEKPAISAEEEQAILGRIDELLMESAQAA